MPKQKCRECGLEKPETRFRTLKKRQDGTYKRSNVCMDCYRSTLSSEYPSKIEFTKHAAHRCRLRRVDTSRLTRTLLSIKLDNGEHKYPIPNTPLIAVYEDAQEERLRRVVTVIVDTSLRLHKRETENR